MTQPEIVLQTAVIVPGSESPTVEGISKPIRCTLITPDGTRRAGIVKRAQVAHIAAEAFCALLLRGWGLNVPEPFIVEEPEGPAFASADAGYPSLCHRLSVNHIPDGPARDIAAQQAMRIAISLKSAALAAAADEAIDNRDRNLGNILWDGTEEAWIDHALALGNGKDHEDQNLLCFMAVVLGQYDNLQRGAIAHTTFLDRSLPITTQNALSHPILSGGEAAFITTRLTGIANRLLARFPKPADLLFGA